MITTLIVEWDTEEEIKNGENVISIINSELTVTSPVYADYEVLQTKSGNRIIGNMDLLGAFIFYGENESIKSLLENLEGRLVNLKTNIIIEDEECFDNDVINIIKRIIEK